MGYAEIVATGYDVPEGIIDNKYIAETNPHAIFGIGKDKDGNPGLLYRVCNRVDERGNPFFSDELIALSYEKIIKNTGGIEFRRRVSDGNEGEGPYESHVDLVERAFKKTGFSASKLDGIIVATISQPEGMNFPGIAWQVQKRLGIRRTDIFTEDIGAACSGFTHALDHAMLRVEKYGGYYLVVGVDTLTRLTDYSEINCDLFGDGCGLAVVGPTEDIHRRILATSFKSIVNEAKQGNSVQAIHYIVKDNKGKIRMPYGPQVARDGRKAMIDNSHDLIQMIGANKDDVAKWFPQQANGNMLKKMEEEMGVEGRIYWTLQRYGNMSAANVPLALAEAIERNVVKRGDLVILVDVGSGLAVGGSAIIL